MSPPRRREALAIGSGVLLVLSFPKFGHGAVAWIALAPLLVALLGTKPAEGARLGYLTGAVSAMGLLYWTALVVVQYGGLSLPVGVLITGLLGLAFGRKQLCELIGCSDMIGIKPQRFPGAADRPF